MSVQAQQMESASLRARFSAADLFTLACGVVVLVSFFFMTWFYTTETVDEEVQAAAQYTGSEVLAWSEEIQALFAPYEETVQGEMEFTRGDVADPLAVIPIAGATAAVLALVGLFVPRYRRTASALALVSGLFALIFYYLSFFLLDREHFIIYYDLTRSMTDNITLTALAGGGFWLALFGVLGLVVQFWMPRPEEAPEGAEVPLLTALDSLLNPLRRLRDRYQEAVATSPSYKRAIGFVFQFQSYFGLIIIIVLAIVFSPIRNEQRIFLNERNLSNVARDVSETGILAVGQLMVILVAGIDLSVGSIVALAATGSAFLLMRDHVPAIPTIIIILGLGAVIGWWNGWTSERFNVPSFVTTLAMLSIARGMAHVWSSDIAVPVSYGPGGGDPLFEIIGERINGVFPVPAIIMFGVAILMGLILHYTAFGRHIYAIGGNETAARLSGVTVTRTKIVAFILSGLFAALAGIVHASQLNQGSPNEAVGYELNAIAAVVIGGASLMGGKGTIPGAIAGAFILGILDNMLSLNNVNSNVQLITKGLLVVAAVALQQFRPSDVE